MSQILPLFIGCPSSSPNSPRLTHCAAIYSGSETKFLEAPFLGAASSSVLLQMLGRSLFCRCYGSIVQRFSVDLQNSSTKYTRRHRHRLAYRWGTVEDQTHKHSHSSQGRPVPQKSCNNLAECQTLTTTFKQNDHRLIYPIIGHGF